MGHDADNDEMVQLRLKAEPAFDSEIVEEGGSIVQGLGKEYAVSFVADRKLGFSLVVDGDEQIQRHVEKGTRLIGKNIWYKINDGTTKARLVTVKNGVPKTRYEQGEFVKLWRDDISWDDDEDGPWDDPEREHDVFVVPLSFTASIWAVRPWQFVIGGSSIYMLNMGSASFHAAGHIIESGYKVLLNAGGLLPRGGRTFMQLLWAPRDGVVVDGRIADMLSLMRGVTRQSAREVIAVQVGDHHGKLRSLHQTFSLVASADRPLTSLPENNPIVYDAVAGYARHLSQMGPKYVG
eukprot:gnl/TRDRNA2_/TRDRNA2_195027_c0_seq1.p1 gnl/TRDRNA2_/TRDRNA2_195027_c0~~gnl/TRDRNA2_/TRDRNA2_195027_c0_seq1.p1  ORF type:complete len:293 (-),score=22.21 gnl/TRDRNA2_/TRDRNA2_195027_c0_seq1:110-988(-)